MRMIQYDLSKSVNIYEEIEMGIDKNLAIPFHFFSHYRLSDSHSILSDFALRVITIAKQYN